MKEIYPSYIDTSFENIKRTLSTKNKKLVTEFLCYCEITASASSIKKISGKIIQIADIIEKPLDSIDLEDVRKFLRLLNKSDRANETQNDTKKIFKRFLKWKYKNWNIKFDEFRDFKFKDGVNHAKLNSETMYSLSEIDFVVRSIDSLKYKCLILCGYEGAPRPEELVKLMWHDINFDKKILSLFSSKTKKPRPVPINESLAHLKRYKEECFIGYPKADDYVFPSPNNPKKHMTVAGLDNYFSKIERNLKLKKRFFPYILRHSRLTVLIKTLSPKVYEKFAGHSIQTGTKRYGHLSYKDVEDEMISKVYKITELTKEEKEELTEIKKQFQEQKKELERQKQELDSMKNGKGFMTLISKLVKQEINKSFDEMADKKFDVVLKN